jgi:energy-converting hydrogenase Eha subunit H
MDFTTILLLVFVIAVSYTLVKAFSKKESVVEAVKDEVAKVETKVVAEIKDVATKENATVKKTTTRKPKAPAKK